MKTDLNIIDNVHVLKLYDRIDASCSQELKEIVEAMIKEGKREFLFDMNSVGFIDSSGLGIMITCLRSINNVGGRMKIAQLQNHTKSVFDMTRMDRIFEIFEDTETAICSFNNRPLNGEMN